MATRTHNRPKLGRVVRPREPGGSQRCWARARSSPATSVSTRRGMFGSPSSRPTTGGERRVGRIVQRLTEIETYKTMAMLALPRARALSTEIGRMDAELSDLVGRLREGRDRDRGDAGGPAHHRLGVGDDAGPLRLPLRRAGGLRGFGQPAHRGAARGAVRRAADLGRVHDAPLRSRDADLPQRAVAHGGAGRTRQARGETCCRRGSTWTVPTRTRICCDSMDGRAAAQLRLQKTVEGLSVVAISYYALNLVAGAALPARGRGGHVQGDGDRPGRDPGRRGRRPAGARDPQAAGVGWPAGRAVSRGTSL